ncbi:CidA/LrgA family holin-like protein [Paenibacillus sp. JX-17]|uniref:CidA/LrgA family holin-like protein n=2 Tax=Paenibacillus lacisoli TaxID=3064525 RepID=A0ABT9CHD7_9BACL|nr:CidA/LrgA family holin-like protein [Paenibacillus sp. JX-17]
MLLKWLRTAFQIAILYLFAWVGTLLQDWLDLPIPGSIIGLLLLLAGLSCRLVKVSWIGQGAGFLLGMLPLFFIPATVGVMNYSSLLSVTGAILLFILILSTVITLTTAGHASQWLENRSLKRKKEEQPCGNSSSPSL